MHLDKSWMNNKGTAKYIEGVKQFVNFVEENANGEVLFTCPCLRCRNSKGHISLDDIYVHLLQHGIGTNYVNCVYHGQKVTESVQHKSALVGIYNDESDHPRMEELVYDVYNEHVREPEDVLGDVNITHEDDQGGASRINSEPEMPENNKYKNIGKWHHNLCILDALKVRQCCPPSSSCKI